MLAFEKDIFIEMISVIVPTYNYGKYLQQCIDSVIAQTIEEWECIVVDNGSTDDTEKIVSNLMGSDDRIRYHKLAENNGPSHARNVGIGLAKGDFIQFLDADDLICQHKFENAMRFFNSHQDAAIVYSDMRYFQEDSPNIFFYQMNTDGSDDKPWMSYSQGRKAEMLPFFLLGNQMVISSPVIKKKDLEQVGMFDESFQFYEDWDFWLRFVLLNKRFICDKDEQSLTIIRVHGTSHSKNPLKMLFGSARICLKYMEQIDDRYLRNRFQLKKHASLFLIDELLYRNRKKVDFLSESLTFLKNGLPNKPYGFFLSLMRDGKVWKVNLILKFYYGWQFSTFVFKKKICQLFLYVFRHTNRLSA